MTISARFGRTFSAIVRVSVHTLHIDVIVLISLGSASELCQFNNKLRNLYIRVPTFEFATIVLADV